MYEGSKKEEYRAFCERRAEVPLFLQPWWLDAVTEPDGKVWDVLLARNNQNEIEAVFPFVKGCKRGIRYAITPQLTQYTGLWIVDKEGEDMAERLSREKKLQNDIIAQLEALHLNYFDVRFPLNYTYWSPFYWAGYKQETRYTYRIEDLSDMEKVLQGLDYAKVKQLRKAKEAGIEVDYGMSADELYDLQCEQLKERGSRDVLSRALVQSVVEASCRRGQGLIVRAKDAEGHTHAAVFVVWDTNSAWELISAISPAYRSTGASTLVVIEAMKQVAGRTKSWDFEGSMIEPVEASFRQFGGLPVPYMTITKKSKLISLIELCRK